MHGVTGSLSLDTKTGIAPRLAICEPAQVADQISLAGGDLAGCLVYLVIGREGGGGNLDRIGDEPSGGAPEPTETRVPLGDNLLGLLVEILADVTTAEDLPGPEVLRARACTSNARNIALYKS